MINKNLKIAVGIPTINRADLLDGALKDLAKNMSDMDLLLLVDNGSQNITVPTEFKKVAFFQSEKNLGVSKSWNHMMKTAFKLSDIDYLLILNDDIVLGKTKKDILELIGSNPDVSLFVGPQNWCAFLMHKSILNTVGFFDEKFFPAYYEDNDYHYRVKLANVKHLMNCPALDPVIYLNSQSIEKDSSLRRGSHKNHMYFKKKWGGDPGEEKFTTPFGK